jgi:excisionase family DNA binding protein
MPQTLAMSLKDAASALGVSHWHLRHLIKLGLLGHVRIGRRVVIENVEIERLLARGRKAAIQ